MEAKRRTAARFDELEAELKAISRWMYGNPELAYREKETADRLVAFLHENGFEVEYPAYGLDTAFAARIGTAGPEIVICAEMDALPEVGHACGHNIIAAAACGTGTALAPLVDELGVQVTVLGTPAEEMYGGKIDLIRAGAFSGAAAAMMIHPAVRDVVDPIFLGVAHIDVEFFGKESHAAFRPQVGVNALDAAVQTYVAISTLRQAMYATDKVHGVITYGGGAPNVIPAYSAMSWYVRAATEERLDELYGKVIQCFEAAATATGCTYEVKKRGHRYADLISNPLLSRLYAANSAELDRPMGRGIDEDTSSSGSTDMGNVSHEVPSIHPLLDIKSAPAVNHQKEFAAHTVSPTGERAIRDGALAMAWTIIDLAEDDLWKELAAPVSGP